MALVDGFIIMKPNIHPPFFIDFNRIASSSDDINFMLYAHLSDSTTQPLDTLSFLSFMLQISAFYNFQVCCGHVYVKLYEMVVKDLVMCSLTRSMQVFQFFLFA